MQHIPKVLQRQILLYLLVADLINIIQSHPQFAKIGRESYFWKLKTHMDFQKPRLSSLEDVDWKRIYYLNKCYVELTIKFIVNPTPDL